MRKLTRPEGLTGNSGMSLIELMIALAGFAIIGYFTSHFISRVSQSDAELSAKSFAQSQLRNLSNLLEKDLKFRELNKLQDLCTSSICTQFQITRLAPSGGSYTVSYSSSCQPIPDSLGKYKVLKFGNSTLEAQQSQIGARSQCLLALNCQAGTYPSLAITTQNVPAGAKIPDYPAKTPNLSTGRAAFLIVGAAICANKTETVTTASSTISQNRIILESAFLGSGEALRIERKETVFSSNNIAKIQMLPN